MPNWKKLIVSGSNAVLNTVTASAFLATESDIGFIGTSSWANSASWASPPILATPLNSIQYNSDSYFSGSTNFTFISSSNSVYLTGSLIVTGSANIGDSQALGLHTSKFFNITTTGAFKIYTAPSSTFTGMFIEYTAISSSNARAGNITAIRSGSSVNYNETTTTDFGDTSGLSFIIAVSSSLLVLSGSNSTANWEVKSIIRAI